MHPRQKWLAIGLLTGFTAHAAVIYKWVDADGVVHYSDQSSPGAEKIVTAAPNLTASGGARNASGPLAASPRTPQGGVSYTDFTITSPAQEQTFFGDDVVGVHLNLNPSLRPNQSITWHLNGKQLDAAPNAVAFALPHLDRGTYLLAATITDQQTSESATSNNVTFYVRQPSELSPQSPLKK